jgi:hypothetical protein
VLIGTITPSFAGRTASDVFIYGFGLNMDPTFGGVGTNEDFIMSSIDKVLFSF